MKKLTALILLFPCLASSDPGAATRYLINEPASLLDVGMIRLRSKLPDFAEFAGQLYKNATDIDPIAITVNAHYDFEDDKIGINYFVITSGLASAEKGCRQIIYGSHSFLEGDIEKSFRHFGYQSADHPKDLAEKLIKRTDVTCRATDVSLSETVTVTSNLASEKIAVIKDDDE